MLTKETDKQIVIDETITLIGMISEEYGIPRVLVCSHIAYFSMLNLYSLYKSAGMEIPDAINEFIQTTYKQVMEDHKELSDQQYLKLNTQGNC